MKNKIFIAVIFLLIMFNMTTRAQGAWSGVNFRGYSALSFYPTSKGIKGGIDGKIYQIIVKNSMTKRELIEATAKLFSEYGIIDSKKIRLNEVNDKMKECTVPFLFETGIGVHPSGSSPLKLRGNMRFEFYDGGVKLSLENFTEEFMIVTYEKKDANDKGSETYQKFGEYLADAVQLAGSTSGYGKFIAKTDKVTENGLSARGTVGQVFKSIKNQIKGRIHEADVERLSLIKSYRERVVEQNNLFDKMIAANEAKWYTLESYLAERKADEKNKNYLEYITIQVEKMIAEQQLYELTKKRWERDIKYIFDGLFIDLTEQINGQIEGIAEDGVQTWEREGDLVVPTDSKKKAKYLKKQKSFTDFDSYDN